jgi:hypothetical protein
MKTRLIKIKLDTIPYNVDEEIIIGFVYNAITSWGGQFRPEDPLFHSLDVKNISMGDLILNKEELE